MENAGNTRPIKGTKIEGKLRSVIERVPQFEFHIRISIFYISISLFFYLSSLEFFQIFSFGRFF